MALELGELVADVTVGSPTIATTVAVYGGLLAPVACPMNNRTLSALLHVPLCNPVHGPVAVDECESFRAFPLRSYWKNGPAPPPYLWIGMVYEYAPDRTRLGANPTNLGVRLKIVTRLDVNRNKWM